MEKQIRELIRQCRVLLYAYKVNKNANVEYLKQYKSIVDYSFNELIKKSNKI